MSEGRKLRGSDIVALLPGAGISLGLPIVGLLSPVVSDPVRMGLWIAYALCGLIVICQTPMHQIGCFLRLITIVCMVGFSLAVAEKYGWSTWRAFGMATAAFFVIPVADLLFAFASDFLERKRRVDD